MKTAIVISDTIKQIMFSPETEVEKLALKLISENHVEVEWHDGTFYSRVPDAAKGYTVEKCSGGYLRAYESENSTMLVLTKKKDAASATNID